MWHMNTADNLHHCTCARHTQRTLRPARTGSMRSYDLDTRAWKNLGWGSKRINGLTSIFDNGLVSFWPFHAHSRMCTTGHWFLFFRGGGPCVCVCLCTIWMFVRLRIHIRQTWACTYLAVCTVKLKMCPQWYVCCIRARARAHAHTHTWTHTHTHTHTHTWTRTQKYLNTHTHTRTYEHTPHISTHTDIWPHTHTHIWTHTHTYEYTLIYEHTHTHTHLNTHRTYQHIQTYDRAHTNTHIWIHTHTHKYEHTHTHTHCTCSCLLFMTCTLKLTENGNNLVKQRCFSDVFGSGGTWLYVCRNCVPNWTHSRPPC
jgi:hypothetical protein